MIDLYKLNKKLKNPFKKVCLKRKDFVGEALEDDSLIIATNKFSDEILLHEFVEGLMRKYKIIGHAITNNEYLATHILLDIIISCYSDKVQELIIEETKQGYASFKEKISCLRGILKDSDIQEIIEDTMYDNFVRAYMPKEIYDFAKNELKYAKQNYVQKYFERKRESNSSA